MAQTTGAIVYPVPTDFVRDGATAMQTLAESIDPPLIAGNVGKGFRPLSIAGAALGTSPAIPVVGPARIRTVHTTATTDASGYINVPTGNVFQHVYYCGITNLGGSLNFDIDKAVTGLAGVLVRVYNPATGLVLGNRAVEYNALIVGI